ncbi:MAG: hypothetical protein U5K51_03530 [Flavobacteriaceae bacterium]|nr:hypothetical protein [Flavobacteriaceae bacterium]
MITIVYDLDKCKEVENAVMRAFQCSFSEIVGYTDTLKKTVA